MAESVIFNSPGLIIGFGIALCFCIVDLKTHSTGYVFPILSVVLCIVTSVAALLSGASLYELSVVVLIFLAVNLTSYFKSGGDDEQ